MKTIITLISSLLLLGYLTSFAQPGSLDISFDPGTGAENGTIYSVAIQPDGKIIIAGSFTGYDGVSANRIARINLDGSFDNTFDPGAGVENGIVRSIVLQSDGKILIGGNFTLYDGTEIRALARINTDGSLDNTFNSVMVTPGTDNIVKIALQPDDKILIAGAIRLSGSPSYKDIIRVNPDGSLDNTFDHGSGTNGKIGTITLLPDNKIMIGGLFSSYNGTNIKNLARLNADGSLDASFDPGDGMEGTTTHSFKVVHAIVPQPDGKILVGGNFDTFNGTDSRCIVRLNVDGSLDSSFDPGSGLTISGVGVVTRVESIYLQSDGKILIGGLFHFYNGTSRRGIARLDANGSLDGTFDPGTGIGTNGVVNDIRLQDGGQIIIGGWFSNYNGENRHRIARLLNDSSVNIAENLFEGNIITYPNPVTEILFIEANTAVQRIELFDIHGKKIAEYTLESLQTEVSMKTLNSGMYLIKIHSEGRTTTRKILKK